MIRKGTEHVVEEVLRQHEQAAASREERLQQDPGGQARLPDAGRPDEHDVVGVPDEVEVGQLLDDRALHSRLPVPGERLQRPALGDLGAVDAGLQEADLPGVVLLAQQPADQLGVGDAVRGGGDEPLVEDLADPAELEAVEQLVEFVIHWGPVGSGWSPWPTVGGCGRSRRGGS